MSNKSTKLTSEEIEFLDHSNRIEREYSKETLDDAKKAWEYAKTCDTIGLPELLEIHRLLLERLDPEIAGKFRDCDVFIGGERKKFLGLALLEAQVDDALGDVNKGEGFGLVAQRASYARRAHVAYEGVHPFADGNGRSGRILYNWQRIKLGLPIHIIHEGEEQMEYYGWFKKN